MQAIHDIMSPGDQTFEGSQSGGYEKIETSESLKRERNERTLPVPILFVIFSYRPTVSEDES